MNWRKSLIALFVVVFGGCCLLFYFCIISYPSTESIARDYLDAVINNDLDKAMRWTQATSRCQDLAMESALKDIDQFGNSEIKNFTIDIRYNTMGSDDEMQFAYLYFDYRKHDDTEWQSAEMEVFTDHEVPGIRYRCGTEQIR